MSTIRNFEYESFDNTEPSQEIDANVSTVMIGEELLIEIRTMGPVGGEFNPNDMQVLRFSKNALAQLFDMAKTLNAQSH